MSKIPSKDCRGLVGPVLSMQEMCPAEVSRSQGAKRSPSSALHIWTLKMDETVISPRQGNHSTPDERLDQSHKGKSTVKTRMTTRKVQPNDGNNGDCQVQVVACPLMNMPTSVKPWSNPVALIGSRANWNQS